MEINEAVTAEIVKIAAPKLFGRGKIVVGRDARLSSPALYKAVKKSLVIGHKSSVIIDGGLMTTPMLYFLVHQLKAAGGIMVTASHNPKEYNGLKFVGREAKAISGTEIKRLVMK